MSKFIPHFANYNKTKSKNAQLLCSYSTFKVVMLQLLLLLPLFICFQSKEVWIINLIKYSYGMCAEKNAHILQEEEDSLFLSWSYCWTFFSLLLISQSDSWVRNRMSYDESVWVRRSEKQKKKWRRKKIDITDEMARTNMWTNGFLFNSLNKFKRNENACTHTHRFEHHFNRSVAHSSSFEYVWHKRWKGDE